MSRKSARDFGIRLWSEAAAGFSIRSSPRMSKERIILAKRRKRALIRPIWKRKKVAVW